MKLPEVEVFDKIRAYCEAAGLKNFLSFVVTGCRQAGKFLKLSYNEMLSN